MKKSDKNYHEKTFSPPFEAFPSKLDEEIYFTKQSVNKLSNQINLLKQQISKTQNQSENLLNELKNTKRKKKSLILSEYFDIYKEFQHRYVICNQINDEITNYNLEYEILISNEKQNKNHIKAPTKGQTDFIQEKLNQQLPKPNEINGNISQRSKTQLINHHLFLGRNQRNAQNNRRSMSPICKPITAFISRKTYVSQQVQKAKFIEETNFASTIPSNSVQLPSLKGKSLKTFVPKTLEALIGRENAQVFKDYTKVMQRFKTGEPERIQDMFDNIKKKNQKLQSRMKLIERDNKKLINKIECYKLLLMKPEDREQKIIDKIDQIAIKCGFSPEGTLLTKVLQIVNFCKDLLKERRQKRLLDKTPAKARVSFRNVVSVKSRKEKNKPAQPLISDIPPLILTPEMRGDYMPRTRITRRTYEIVNEGEKRSNELNSVDMILFGRELGKTLVVRYAPKFSVYPQMRYDESPFSIVRPAHIFLSPQELENPKIILAELIGNYKKNSQNLHISIFTVDEIYRIMPDMIQFISTRDQLIKQFEKYFDEKLFIDMFSELLTNDISAACFLARDFTMKTRIKDSSAMLLGKMLSHFVQIDAQVDALPFYSAFDAFLSIPKNNSLKNSIISLFSDATVKFMDDLIKQPMKPFVRSALTILFSIARHHATTFAVHANLVTSTYSTVQLYIEENLEYPTCVKTGIAFFTATSKEWEEETVLWHFPFFQYLLNMEFLKNALRIEIIQSLLGIITFIVTNRTAAIKDQMKAMHFLKFLMKNISLEEQVGEKIVPDVKPIQPKVTIQDMNRLLPKLNLDNPKLQLALPPQRGIPYVQPQSITQNEYADLRSIYPIYYNEKIHIAFMQLVFASIIDHSLHSFDKAFVDQFPHVNRKPNIMFTIMKHMEREENQSITKALNDAFTPRIPELPRLGLAQMKRPTPERFDDTNQKSSQRPQSSQRSSQRSQRYSAREGNQTMPTFIANTVDEDDIILNTSRKNFFEKTEHRSVTVHDQIEQFHDYKRFLRLLSPELFNPEQYQNGQHIASGAFGAVMQVTINDTKFAVKVLQKSRNEFDNPKLVEVYSEISILDLCRGDRRVTQLVNYGCTADSYYIVMEYYPMTLKSWRKAVADDPPLPTILRVYREFLRSAKVLLDYRINHFDIKCDNVMMDFDGYPALADFGESMCYQNEQNSYTQLNKGTEWIKSPEMLSIAINSTTTNPNFDRRRQFGAGPASDIWSIGCLFYELVTGEFLFVDTDWSRFFMRVTDPKEALISPKCMKLLPKDVRFSGFLEFVLQRAVPRRPNLAQVIKKFDDYFPDAMDSPLPDMHKLLEKKKQEQSKLAENDVSTTEESGFGDDMSTETELDDGNSLDLTSSFESLAASTESFVMSHESFNDESNESIIERDEERNVETEQADSEYNQESDD